jgi:hypothetical protein
MSTLREERGGREIEGERDGEETESEREREREREREVGCDNELGFHSLSSIASRCGYAHTHSPHGVQYDRRSLFH